MSASYGLLLRRLSSRTSGSGRRIFLAAAAGRQHQHQQQQQQHNEQQKHRPAAGCSARFLSSGSGSGGSGSGDDDSPNKDNSSNSTKKDKDKQKKPQQPATGNFDRDVLQPAAEGHLTGKHHSSGIPHLAGRHPHATLEPVRGRAGKKKDPLNEEGDVVAAEEEEADADAANAPSATSSSSRTRMFNALAAGRMDTDGLDGYDDGGDSLSPEEEIEHYAALLDEDAKFGYWNVADVEDNLLLDRQVAEQDGRIQAHEAALKAIEDQRLKHKQMLRGEISASDDNGGGAAAGGEEKDDGDNGDDEGGEDSSSDTTTSTTPSFKDKVPKLDLMDDYDTWFEKNYDLMQLAENDYMGMEEDEVEQMSPSERAEYEKHFYSVGNMRMMDGRAVSGAAGMDYYTGERTKRQMATHSNPHPDSAREPVPFIPVSRKQPSLEFLEKYRRFLYVFGLPVLDPGDGSRATLENPVHFEQVRKELARVTGIGSGNYDCFYPATPRSGYVGFESPEALAAAIVNGPAETTVCRPPVWSVYSSAEEYPTRRDPDTIRAFVDQNNDNANSVLVLSLIPRNHTRASLLEALFPPGTPVGDAYSNVTRDDIFFVNNTTAFVRFASQEEAESALSSQFVSAQLRDSPQLGSAYRIRYQIARRNMVHAGWRGPYIGRKEVRRWGHRLLVDGDMPTKNFYISHADTVLAWNLDPGMTKWELSQMVQPYSTLRRDIEGSIEIVMCEDFLPTGQAYIGFDYPGEADTMLEALGPAFKLGHRTIHFKKVKNRRIRGKYYNGPERRPDRTVEELWEDLDGWERFVDPADLETLEKAGIDKWVLDDALRVIRYKNETFGPFDQGMRRERLRPELEAGQQYREIVQLYVKTLIECLPTPEEPGAIYEALHFPDQPIDLSIFDDEKERRKALRAHRASVGGAEKVKRKSVGSK